MQIFNVKNCQRNFVSINLKLANKSYKLTEILKISTKKILSKVNIIFEEMYIRHDFDGRRGGVDAWSVACEGRRGSVEHKVLAVRAMRQSSRRERAREKKRIKGESDSALVVVAAARRSHSTANIRASSAHTVRSRVSVTWDRVHFLRRCFFFFDNCKQAKSVLEENKEIQSDRN
jgi:hypothetical protein